MNEIGYTVEIVIFYKSKRTDTCRLHCCVTNL